MADVGIMTNVLYIVLDIVLIILGLLFVMKWGKQGLLATTLWLLVGGMMVQMVGDVLGTLGENFSLNTELVTDGSFTVGLTDITYWGALLLWMVAFFIPVKFAFIDSKKLPKEEQVMPEGEVPPGAPPQGAAPQAPVPAPGGSPPPPPGA